MNWQDGAFILIDKPLEWTSFDVVKKVRNVIKAKVGHAGTLDPLATGLLILATGKFTKKIEEVQSLNKEYEGVFEIGKTTPSYDLETDFDSQNPTDHITPNQLEQAKEIFLGDIEQTPPAHSAIKINGERAYKKARKNEDFILKSRIVSINQFTIDHKENDDYYFNVKCTKGTYIRSLIHDYGQELGTGAYLKSLRRLKIGEFTIDKAHKLKDFIDKYKSQ